MDVFLHGIDLVEVARIEEMIARHGDRFLDRIFTAGERDYAELSAKRMGEHLAGRFAVKEAVLKALGTGWRYGILWTDVEVVREESGRPILELHGEAKVFSDRAGVTGWRVSISHTKDHAMASVIGWGSGGNG